MPHCLSDIGQVHVYVIVLYSMCVLDCIETHLDYVAKHLKVFWSICILVVSINVNVFHIGFR